MTTSSQAVAAGESLPFWNLLRSSVTTVGARFVDERSALAKCGPRAVRNLSSCHRLNYSGSRQAEIADVFIAAARAGKAARVRCDHHVPDYPRVPGPTPGLNGIVCDTRCLQAIGTHPRETCPSTRLARHTDRRCQLGQTRLPESRHRRLTRVDHSHRRRSRVTDRTASERPRTPQATRADSPPAAQCDCWFLVQGR